MKTHYYILICTFLLAATTSCDHVGDVPPKYLKEYYGDKVAIGDGHAWSYIQTNKFGTPMAVGLQFDETALNNLPTGSPHGDEFVLPLPKKASVPPFDHITLDWNEMGHEPPGVYDLPHFDMHFYFIDMDARNAITPDKEDEFNKPLAPEFLPPDYLETPGGVPRMGAHIIDLLSPEIAGTGTFTHTFIFGKFDGEMNFLEPMVTREHLLNKTMVDKEIRQPTSWQQPGWYPQRYTITFDEETKVYTVLLKDLEEF